MEKVFPCRQDPLKCSYIMGFFPCRDSFDYGWAWDVRYFHIRFLGDHLGHVGARWLYYPSTSCPSVSLESVHYEESVCLFAFPFETIPFTSSLIVRPSRPSLLTTPLLMTNVVDWIRLPWVLSLSKDKFLYIYFLQFVLRLSKAFYMFLGVFNGVKDHRDDPV